MLSSQSNTRNGHEHEFFPCRTKADSCPAPEAFHHKHKPQLPTPQYPDANMKPTRTTPLLNNWRGLALWPMAATVLALMLAAGTLHAQVTNIIYQDTFARVGALDGSAPDTVNLPGANWFACNVPGLNAQIQTDGSEIALTNAPGTTNGYYLNGFLPFTPQFGHTYYLSCNVKPIGGGTNWVALGFASRAVTNIFYNTYQCGAGHLQIRGTGTNFQTWGSLVAATTFPNPIGTNLQTFTVALDLSLGNANYGGQIRFYTNGVLVAGGNQTMTGGFGNYPVKYVGIGADKGQAYFQNFTLIDVRVRNGAPTIIESPQNATAQVGQTATFWVGVTNDYPVASYQWMTNSTGGPTNAIPGATNASYTTPALDSSYNGLNYSVSVTNINGATNSPSGALTVVSGPPTVFSVTKTPSLTNFVVAFSKAVDPVTALNAANYAAQTSGGTPAGLSILSASYGSGSNSVILKTSTINTNTGYYLKVQNVQDLFGNTMSTSTNVVLPSGLVFFVRADSGVIYDNSGTQVAIWQDQTTNRNDASQFFGVPTAGTGYVATVARPTISNFNNGQLSLNFGNLGTTNWLAAPSTPSLESLVRNITMYAVANFTGPSDDIVNKCLGNLPAPFDWDPNPNENIQYGNGGNNAPANGLSGTPQNQPLVLSSTLSFPPENGLATNFFNFWLQGTNNGNGNIRPLTDNPATNFDQGFPLWIGARWDLVNPHMRGQIAEILLFNTAISDADRTNVDNYLGQKYFTFAITTDLPPSTTSSNGFAVTYNFVAGAGSSHGVSLQWVTNDTDVPGVTGNSYTTPTLGPSDNGEKIYVRVTLPNGSFVYSTTNILTVLTQPPYVNLAGITIWNSNQIILTFDEAVDPTTAAVAANYSLNNGASVFSAAMGDASNKVVLTTSSLSFNANPGFYSLTVQNVNDLYGNTIVTASTPLGLYPNTALWLRANTGVTTDSGTNTVAQWTDLSGNGNTFFGGGGPTIQPIFTTNALGDPVVRFNQVTTVTNYLAASSSSSLAIVGDMSAIAVMNVTSLAGGRNGHIVAKTGPPPRGNIPAPYDYNVGTVASLLRGNGNGTVGGVNFGSFAATNSPSTNYPFVVAVSETGNTVSHYLNGQAAGIGVLSAGFQEVNCFDNGNSAYIGARSDGFNRLVGDLAELILAASPMSSAEAASLATYLSAQHHFVLFNPSRTNIVVSSTNNQITLSWPADHTGWQLQSNSVGITATGSWFLVPGSTATNKIIITPSAPQQSVYYRMVFQQP